MSKIKTDPRSRRVPVGITLPCWVLDWLDEQPESRGRLLEEALIEKHNLTKIAGYVISSDQTDQVFRLIKQNNGLTNRDLAKKSRKFAALDASKQSHLLLLLKSENKIQSQEVTGCNGKKSKKWFSLPALPESDPAPLSAPAPASVATPAPNPPPAPAQAPEAPLRALPAMPARVIRSPYF